MTPLDQPQEVETELEWIGGSDDRPMHLGIDIPFKVDLWSGLGRLAWAEPARWEFGLEHVHQCFQVAEEAIQDILCDSDYKPPAFGGCLNQNIRRRTLDTAACVRDAIYLPVGYTHGAVRASQPPGSRSQPGGIA